MSNPTEKELFGSFLPFPNIKNISLESGGTAVKEKNPHIDTSTMADGTPNPFGNPNFVENSGNLKVAVTAVVKDIVTFSENEFSSGWLSSDIAKFINVTIIQSHSATLTEKMLKNVNIAVAFAMPKSSDPWNKIGDIPNLSWLRATKISHNYKERIQTKSLATIKEGTEDKKVKFETYIDANGSTITEYPIECTFNHNNSSPNHLAYFCVATLDFDLMASELGIEQSDITNSVSSLYELAEVSHVIAIDGGKITSLRNKFFLENGIPWEGLVHYNQEIGWMGGKIHIPGPHPRLSVKKIASSLVRDFRSSISEDIDLSSLYDIDSQLNKVINDFSKTTYKHKTPSRRSYIHDCIAHSEPKISSQGGLISSTGIFFILDMAGLLADHSSFPGLYKTSSKASSFVQSSKIRSLKVLRKQSRESHGLNSLGTPTVTSDPVNNDTPAKVIASFSDLGTSANIVEIR